MPTSRSPSTTGGRRVLGDHRGGGVADRVVGVNRRHLAHQQRELVFVRLLDQVVAGDEPAVHLVAVDVFHDRHRREAELLDVLQHVVPAPQGISTTTRSERGVMASDTFMHRLTPCHLLYTAKVVHEESAANSPEARVPRQMGGTLAGPSREQ